MQSNYDMDIYGEAPDKMTYTEQANKRSQCKRLTWWVGMIDSLLYMLRNIFLMDVILLYIYIYICVCVCVCVCVCYICIVLYYSTL